MASFGRTLSRAVAFGKQLAGGANVFGRQVANTGGMIRRNIQRAEDVVSRIERAVPDVVPVLDPALKALKSGLTAGKQAASLGEVGGNALRQASRGDVGGLRASAGQAQRLGGGLAGSIRTFGSDAGSAAAQAAMFI